MTMTFTLRRRHAIALGLVVLLTAGAAAAAILFRLRGTGTSTGLNTTLIWASANGTNDDGDNDTGMDPTSDGMVPATRAAYNVGSSNLALTDNTLVLTITNSYEQYRTTTHAVAAVATQDVVVQNVVAGGADAALIEARLDPVACGLNLKTAEIREIDIGFTVGAVESAQNLSFTFDVIAVPTSDYNPALCSSWTP